MTPDTCPHCHRAVDPTDNFCRGCGRSLKPGHNFWYSHSGIILLTLVLGPFALPMVWLSKRISLAAKWIYSVVLVVLGFYFVLACYHIYQAVFAASQLFLGGGF
ncbi:MAG: zinc ribbon domain-containing protein [Elusimicrobiaceae bacterium]|nr:zinc ribbon domain-containing protein [Elusimicrobiaceae bacterium]